MTAIAASQRGPNVGGTYLDEAGGEPVSTDAVLVVCTANQCRSPFAAAMLARLLADRDPRVEVRSAGLDAVGLPATPRTVEAASALGLDLSLHTSRRVDHAALVGVSLVLAMERLHARQVSVLDPDAFPKTFTVKELVRRGTALGRRGADEPLRRWVARAHAGRRHANLLGASIEDDVADPTADPFGDHDAMAREVAALLGALVDLAWPPPAPGGVT
jgi:protein-tyrosine phosphatase